MARRHDSRHLEGDGPTRSLFSCLPLHYPPQSCARDGQIVTNRNQWGVTGQVEKGMFHRSDRLLLRPVFAEDWQEIHQAINDEGVVRMLASAPWPYREDDARDFAARGFDRRHPRMLVQLPGSLGSPVIGCVGIDGRDEGIELGYWIARPFWGRGFATEAGRALIMLARMIGHRTILAGHAVDNPASGKVLRKLGFRPTGEVRSQFSKGRGAETPVARYVNEIAMAAGMSSPSDMQQAA